MRSSFIAVLLISTFLLAGQFSTANAQTTNPGIEALITSKGLTQFQNLANPLLNFFLMTQRIAIPDQFQDLIELKVNLTNMLAESIRYTDFTLKIIPNEGLQFEIAGLQGKINYELSYEILFPRENGSFSSTATFSDTSIILLFNFDIDSSNGKPIVNVTSSDFNVGSLDLGFSGNLEKFYKVIEPILITIIDNVVSDKIIPGINTVLYSKTEELNMQMFLDPYNKTVLDFSLNSKPIINSDGIFIYLKGDVHAVGSTCPFTIPPFAPTDKNTVRALISGTVIDCGLYAFLESGVLNDLVNDLIKEKLPFDDRLSLSLNFTTQGSDVRVTPSGIYADLQLYAIMYQGKGPSAVKFITFDINVTAAATVGMVGFNIVPSVNSVNVHFNVMEFNGPESWRERIMGSNWTQLEEKADLFLEQSILPAINQQIGSGFALPIPPIASGWLKNVELVLYEGDILFGLDFNGKSSETMMMALSPSKFPKLLTPKVNS